jgi:hypothetical protein
MMSIETSDERRIEREAIGLYKLEGIARLRSDIDADYIEPCLMVAHRGPACAAEPVQQFRTPAHPTTPLALVLGEERTGQERGFGNMPGLVTFVPAAFRRPLP